MLTPGVSPTRRLWQSRGWPTYYNGDSLHRAMKGTCNGDACLVHTNEIVPTGEEDTWVNQQTLEVLAAC